MIDEGCPRAPELKHGTRYAYQNGCECHAARRANRDYARRWQRTPTGRAQRERYEATRRLPDGATPARTAERLRRQHLARELWERGVSCTNIARRMGVAPRTVERYISPLRT